MKKSKIAVLLSSYNGEKYIEEQIDSVLNQQGVDIHLFIRDDGSTDGTIDILKKMQSDRRITVYFEKNIGYAKSFWNLMNKAEEYDYYCFCDQDDIWLNNKIFKAIELIQKEETKYEDSPVLYTSRAVSINNNKDIINENTFNNNRTLSVYESFQKSVFPGCVFVFNKNARNLLIKYDGYMESHDWAAYTIISVFGKTIYDSNSYIHYRIHDNNTIGKQSVLKTVYEKVKRFFTISKCTRSNFADSFYNKYKDVIPEKYIEDIKELAFYKRSLKNKMNLFFNKNFKGIIFKVYVLLNKV